MRSLCCVSLAVFAIVVGVVIPCVAQAPPGPATLETLANSPEAQSAQAAPEAADSGPKRPAGTVARPKDGVQHPDLDKAWAEYDAVVTDAAEVIRSAIAKQFNAATDKGDLDAAEKWQAASEKFAKAGEVPSGVETKAAVSAAVADLKRAKRELSKAYESVVKSLTMQTSIAEAQAARDEWQLMAGSEPLDRMPLPVFLSDLQERNAFVGYGEFGKNGELGYERLKIIVGGNPSPKGVSLHPPSNGTSQVTYDIPEGYTHFEGHAAIADGRLPQKTPVVFRVLSEQGRILWQSQPIRGAGALEKCVVPLRNAKAITLTVACPGAFNYAYAVWVEPRFVAK